MATGEVLLVLDDDLGCHLEPTWEFRHIAFDIQAGI